MTAGDACTVAGAVTGAVTAGVTAGAIGTAGGNFKPRDLASTDVRFGSKADIGAVADGSECTRSREPPINRS